MAPSRKSKKQKLEATTGGVLGLKNQSAQKEENELDLEEAVFGKSSRSTGSIWESDKPTTSRFDFEEEEQDLEIETGLDRVEDDALFFVDVPTASGSSPPPPFFSPFAAESDQEESEEEVVDKTIKKSGNRKRAAWVDAADQDLTVSLKDVARLRKLRVEQGEDLVSGVEYEARLRRQFEKMHPVPAWATEARQKIQRKRNRKLVAHEEGQEDISENSDISEDEESEVEELFRTSGNKLKGSKKGLLKEGEIDIDRVRDANQVEPNSGTVVEIGFHPRAQVLFSATSDRRLRLFQIDGTDNQLIQTIHVPELPISSAAFDPSGSTILMTGTRPYYYAYDMQTGTVTKSGTRLSGEENGGLEKFKFSPDGSMLAIGGKRGIVQLLDYKGTGIPISKVKMNSALKGIAWAKDGEELLTLDQECQVYVWDIRTNRCIRRWKDDGGFGAVGLKVSNQDKYTAIASSTGIVNIYDPSTNNIQEQGIERKAFKTIDSLTTAVTSLSFSHDSQILAIASRTNKDQLRLVHTNSGKVFSNWPTQTTPLHHVTSTDFSKGSEFLAVGNQRGKVLLYNLKHY